jgi:hypothetical protein
MQYLLCREKQWQRDKWNIGGQSLQIGQRPGYTIVSQQAQDTDILGIKIMRCLGDGLVKLAECQGLMRTL